MVVLKGLLKRVKATVLLGEPLDSSYGSAVRLHREHQATINAMAINKYRAGAARAGLTTQVGTGQAELIAQAIGKGFPWLHFDDVAGAVYRDGDATRLCHPRRLVHSTALDDVRVKAKSRAR